MKPGLIKSIRSKEKPIKRSQLSPSDKTRPKKSTRIQTRPARPDQVDRGVDPMVDSMVNLGPPGRPLGRPYGRPGPWAEIFLPSQGLVLFSYFESDFRAV